jgi:hypothetical protein
MTRHSIRSAIVVIGVLLIFALAPDPGASQTPAAYTPPRTRDGHPDLQGVWQALNTAAWSVEDHPATLGVPAGHGVVDGGVIPYQPSALARRNEHFANRATLDPETKCYLPGVPRITYMPHPFRIVQQADRITILYEYLHAVRYVFMNGRPHPPGPIDWWMGDSRGRWEGNSLVVDVTHLSDRTWLDRAGNFHSEAVHVVERYTPAGPDHLLYEVTLEDPKVYTRPWKMTMPLYRRQGANNDLLEQEYDCYPELLEQEWEKPDSALFGRP